MSECWRSALFCFHQFSRIPLSVISFWLVFLQRMRIRAALADLSSVKILEILSSLLIDIVTFTVHFVSPVDFFSLAFKGRVPRVQFWVNEIIPFYKETFETFSFRKILTSFMNIGFLRLNKIPVFAGWNCCWHHWRNKFHLVFNVLLK